MIVLKTNDDLKYILDNVNGWLKYAEAKNIALLTILGVVLGLLVTLFDILDIDNIMLLSLIPVVLGCLILLRSLFPITAQNKDMLTEKNECKNLMFYGCIKNYICNKDEIKYLNDLGIENPSKLEIDISNQIIYNSKITQKKFNYFTWSLRVVLIVPLIIHWGVLAKNKFLCGKVR